MKTFFLSLVVLCSNSAMAVDLEEIMKGISEGAEAVRKIQDQLGKEFPSYTVTCRSKSDGWFSSPKKRTCRLPGEGQYKKVRAIVPVTTYVGVCTYPTSFGSEGVGTIYADKGCQATFVVFTDK